MTAPPMASAPPVLVEVRERRGLFGRVVKRFFFGFQLLMLAASLGTCALVSNYMSGPDPDVAMGAGLFGLSAFAVLWTLWPLGTVVLGVLVLATRGRKRLIPAPGTVVPPAAPPHRPGGSVPETGPRR
ncbi:hypothetical protein JYK14_22400 [Siccirubricoccus sp. KC 17139]|uniref:Uncharacterized protein n=1 Tax=Siccirubricoccus soli TaxID=2899147 RepID=A0ABT1DAB8_9PROT|nr:hypothetical protein [Siccirubricoccus soli]MCO6418887.1 hypothetical protein [Siccirubricoccus soli]MCP2685022.1 hypothetical protein [Siccirubricoccus soli]